MVKHIVIWKLKEDIDKAEAIANIKEKLEGLVGEVPGLLTAQVGAGFIGWDVCLVSEVESKEALEAYQNWPSHVAAKQYIGTVAAERVACDYIC